MRIPFAISALTLASLSAATAPAIAAPHTLARSPGQQAALGGTTFAGLTIAGAVAAGPLGFVLGALGGAFLADQSRQANATEIVLAQAERDRAHLQNALGEQEVRFHALEKEVVAKLTFQILFATGSDTLSEMDMQRVHALAAHLTRNPNLVVTLDGHADPRGTDEYNNVLSHERAKAVKDALEILGVAADRIRYQGHGNRFSTSGKGDEDAFRQERRVDITVEPAAPVYAHF